MIRSKFTAFVLGTSFGVLVVTGVTSAQRAIYAYGDRQYNSGARCEFRRQWDEVLLDWKSSKRTVYLRPACGR